MAWTISDLFPPWGDTGERPSDNFQYTGGDQVNEKHFDYLWDNVNNLENEIRTALQDIDADQDGIVDETDSVTAGGSLNGDLVDSAATPVTIWDDLNKWIPTTRLQADTDGDSLIESYDETLLKDGGSREIDAAEFAGALGSSGQVLTSDGAAASWQTASGVWQEDGNSPQTSLGVTSDTYTLASSYDIVLVFIKIEEASGSGHTAKMELNGDTGSNYLYVTNSDARTTGATNCGNIFNLGSNQYVTKTIEISGRWTGTCSGRTLPTKSNQGDTVAFENNSIISPLDSVTIFSGSSFDITWQVFGRDIGTAGEP